MPEAPVHWYKNFLDYHKNALEMSHLALVSRLLYGTTSRSLEGAFEIQVDDTICAVAGDFFTKGDKC